MSGLFGLLPDGQPEESGDGAVPVRVLVVVAHPDDEVIGAGGRLPHLRDVTVVHITDGAPRDMRDAAVNGFATREAYAAARRAELCAAAALAGIDEARLWTFGIVDQEAAFALAAIATRLAALIDLVGPGVILTHPYEGGHPDHDATALAVHAAARIAHANALEAPPPIIEMAAYHAGQEGIETGEFLPVSGHVPHTVLLSADDRERKRRMCDCFVTQRCVLDQFPIDRERFRQAPCYRFTAPPHEGRLFYEYFDWGMSGAHWCALARHMLASLELEEPL